MPRGIQELALQVAQAERQLAAKTGREPTYNEVAEFLEISVEDVLEAAEASAAHHAVSFDTPHDDGDGEAGTLGDSIGEIDERFDLVDTDGVDRAGRKAALRSGSARARAAVRRGQDAE